MAMMMALFFVVAVCVRLGTAALARGNEEELRFEEEAAPAVLELGLHRDGVMPMGPEDG